MKLVLAICFLAAGASISACEATNQRWRETVELSDGRVVDVERETLDEPGGDEWAFNRAGVKPREYRIRFMWPEGTGQMIEWKSVKKSPSTWPESPLVFDIEAGHPVVYTILHVSSACEIYLKYRYEDSVWKEERLPERFEQRETNLLIRDGTDMPKVVTLPAKRVSNAQAGYRKTIRHVGPNRKVCR